MLALAVGASAAMGHDHRPPPAELRGGGQALKLGYWTYSWDRSIGDGWCATTHADGIPAYKPRLLVKRRRSLPRVFFHKGQRPERVSLYQYRRLRNGHPVGDGRRLSVDLLPQHQDGEILGWAVRFRASVPDRRFYEIEARWRDEEGCLSEQSVNASFRLVRTALACRSAGRRSTRCSG